MVERNNMDYKEIIDNLRVESVIELMKRLGADRYVEKDNCVIFPTICHNLNAAEASMKLYFYKDKKIFMCYTECDTMSIMKQDRLSMIGMRIYTKSFLIVLTLDKLTGSRLLSMIV